jgi:hypothetical protein
MSGGWCATARWACGMTLLLGGLLAAPDVARGQPAEATPRQAGAGDEQIDFQRAQRLLQRRNRGETLSAEETAYLQRAMEARRNRESRPDARRGTMQPRESTGLTPLTEMTADARYEGEDGGLYGGGRNEPSAELAATARAVLADVTPRDESGRPATNGKIVFVSISMSNATQEYSRFKQLSDRDTQRSPQVVVVDCAQGGQAMAQWAPPDARPWEEALRRISQAGVTPQQVQVAWVKLANVQPQGTLEEHGGKLQRDTVRVLQNARQRFPNLSVVYLGSRIYGGYATGALNPEPYAYESAFIARRLILAQQKGDPELNWDAARGEVKAPLLLWGPYLWGDGMTPRQLDQLVWERNDFGGDGVHPSDSGRDKVARMLLDFCQHDPLAASWYLAPDERRKSSTTP